MGFKTYTTSKQDKPFPDNDNNQEVVVGAKNLADNTTILFENPPSDEPLRNPKEPEKLDW